MNSGSDLSNKGEAVRRAVLGDDYVDRAMSRQDEFTQPFQQMLNEYCWGACWSGDGLDLKQRSLITLCMLAALGRTSEFALHYRGAMRNGLSDRELQAALIQIAVYCGVPAGVMSFKTAVAVRKEVEAETGEINDL